MEIRYRTEQWDSIRFGAFPSVNPSFKQKTEPVQKENKEESALSIACSQGKYERVKFLIDQGTDINTKDSSNLSPIMRAATGGHRDIVELLVNSGAKISYDLLCSVKAKIDLLEEQAQSGIGDPYAVAVWKNFLDYLIGEGKKQ